jgi:hypothetical protein
MRANPPVSVLARHLLRRRNVKELFMSRGLSFLPLAAAALFGCSSGVASTGPDGGTGANPPNTSAPTIKDFVLTPTTLTVGKTAEVGGGMTIEDLDGDIAGASGDVLFPDGKVVPIQEVKLTAGSAKSVPVVYRIPALPVPLAGDYVVSVQASDVAGNLSAKATFKLTAQ